MNLDINIFLFEKYQEFYFDVELHHQMNIHDFLNDEYIYNQIHMIFYTPEKHKTWYQKKNRKNKMNTIIK